MNVLHNLPHEQIPLAERRIGMRLARFEWCQRCQRDAQQQLTLLALRSWERRCYECSPRRPREA